MSQEKEFPQHANLIWDDQGQPLSESFGDIYFSKANGLAETRHVFLQHNQLADRWRRLVPGSSFTIAETGFGSGLNFLAAWQLWLNTAPASAQLHFISVEKYPLRSADLTRALALWPELGELAEQLIQSYPVIVGNGFHRLKFMGGRVILTLIIDDAALGFGKLLATSHPLYARTGPKVDAWFLDGFAPSKNPQMWSNELFTLINKLSKPGTTAATFSAAAIVKNGLKGAGFTVEKVAGFGRKREMVRAIYTHEPERLDPADFARGSYSPYPVPWTIDSHPITWQQKTVAIIGGGLAGCQTARAMAERGWKVTLIDSEPALANQGSGNPQGVLYAKLSPMEEAQAAFNLACLQYALNFYRPLWNEVGSACGVLQLAHKASEVELQELLRPKFAEADELVQFVDANKASELANTPLVNGGLFFPTAGWIDPRKLCTYLANHPSIHTVVNTRITQLEQAETGWRLHSAGGLTSEAEAVVIASASQTLGFPQADHLPIKAIRGQISYLPQTAESPAIRTVICAEGYIAPAQDGRFCTGATFNLRETTSDLRAEDQQANLTNLKQFAPAFKASEDLPLAGRVGFRCTLPDYLPAVGPLPDVDALVRDFAPLRKNAKACVTATGSYLPGLYINIGHGARGLAYTPLCAELLASHINGEPLPMPRELANSLHPARFVIRDITRSKR